MKALILFAVAGALVGFGANAKKDEKSPANRWTYEVPAGGKVEYTIEFSAFGIGKFVALGEGNGDLNIRVFDEKGQVVAEDMDIVSDLCSVSWKVIKTQKYRIEVTNPAVKPNKARMGHNVGSGC